MACPDPVGFLVVLVSVGGCGPVDLSIVRAHRDEDRSTCMDGFCFLEASALFGCLLRFAGATIRKFLDL